MFIVLFICFESDEYISVIEFAVYQFITLSIYCIFSSLVASLPGFWYGIVPAAQYKLYPTYSELKVPVNVNEFCSLLYWIVIPNPFPESAVVVSIGAIKFPINIITIVSDIIDVYLYIFLLLNFIIRPPFLSTLLIIPYFSSLFKLFKVFKIYLLTFLFFFVIITIVTVTRE